MDRLKDTWRTLRVCSLLAAATFAAYWPVFHNTIINTDDHREGHLWFRVT